MDKAEVMAGRPSREALAAALRATPPPNPITKDGDVNWLGWSDAILAALPSESPSDPERLAEAWPLIPDPDAPLHVRRTAAADLARWTADRFTALGFGWSKP